MTNNNANNATRAKCRFYIQTRNGLTYQGSMTCSQGDDVVYEGLCTGLIPEDTNGLVLMFWDGEDNAPYIRQFTLDDSARY